MVTRLPLKKDRRDFLALAEALWISEVRDSAESHKASITLPSVKAAITEGRPLIAGFSNRTETTPVGGLGLTHR